MAESYGWAGKILRVNLTTGEITTQDDGSTISISAVWAWPTALCMRKLPWSWTPMTRRLWSSLVSAP